MSFMNKILAVICTAIILLSSTGCSGGDSNARVYFELPETPLTVDPQTASSISEQVIVRNLFEGLLRYNAKGEIVNGVAEEYSVNGLDYTFKVRKNAVWDDGTKVTAHDFVFGMRRAINPATKSPFASRLFSIAGAEAVFNGGANIESLGVKALDKHTLKITLCRQDADFLHNLTTAPFMPCNEKFFKECIGKYGLSPKYILANGSYYMAKWNQEIFGIRLYRNAEYKGDFRAANGGVFLSKNDESTPLKELIEKKVDLALLGSGEREKAEKENLSTKSVQNICWVLTLNGEMDADMRRAFMSLIDKSVYASDLPCDFTPAASLYPNALNTDGSADGMGITPYNTLTAKNLFSAAIKKSEDKTFPKTVLKYYDNDGIKDAVTSIVGHWQQNLSAFMNVEGVADKDYLLGQLTNPTLQMAIFPVTADGPSVKDYLNIYGVTQNTKSAAENQVDLLKTNRIVPIAFQDTTLAFGSKVSNISIDAGNGYIDFCWITKDD